MRLLRSHDALGGLANDTGSAQFLTRNAYKLGKENPIVCCALAKGIQKFKCHKTDDPDSIQNAIYSLPSRLALP